METAISAVPQVLSVLTEKICSSKYQARRDFDEESIKRLAESIQLEGLIQPISVRKVGDIYELIAGERRFRAVKLLGWTAINALVVEVVSEAEAAAKGLIENLQRKDLNPIEEAEGIQKMLDLKDSHWTQEQIGKVVGKTQSEISRTLRFLDLPEQVKQNMRIRIISPDNGVELIRLPSADLQLKVADMIIDKGLNSKATRKVVDGLIKPKKAPRKKIQSANVAFMAPVWPELMANTKIDACGYWSVEFKKDNWNFKASAKKFGSKEDFAAWFRQLADAIAPQVHRPAAGSPER